MVPLPDIRLILQLIDIPPEELLPRRRREGGKGTRVWRTFGNWRKGITRPSPRSWREFCADVNRLYPHPRGNRFDPKLPIETANDPSLQYEAGWRSLCRGAAMAGAYPFLRHEIIRLLDQSAYVVTALDRENVAEAHRILADLDLPRTSFTNLLLTELADIRDPIEWARSCAPIQFITLFYILACWEIEEFGSDERRSIVFNVKPVISDGIIKMPGARWCESIKAHTGKQSNRSLGKLLKYDRASVVKFAKGRQLPPLKQVRRWAHSVATDPYSFIRCYVVVRLLHHFCERMQSRAAHDAPWISYFAAYPALRSHAIAQWRVFKINRGASKI